MKRSFLPLSLLLGGTLALLPLGGAGASRAMTPRTVVDASGLPIAAVGTSPYLAGYVGSTPGSSASFSVTFKVPKITCTGTTTGWLFPLTFLNGSQNGSGTGSGGEVIVNCSGSTPQIEATLIVDDQGGPSETVASKQVITVSGSAGPTGESYTLSDPKAGPALSDSGPGFDVQDVQLTLQGTGLFPTFSTLKYSGATVNSGLFGALNPSGFNEVDASNNVEIKVGNIKNGNSFTLKDISNT